ncbi:hypothetical protein EGW08_007219, partial [Elysia chlorotica]
MKLVQILVCTIVVFMTVQFQGCKSAQYNDYQKYLLEVNLIKETSSRLRVIWFLTQGNIRRIKRFQFIITSENYTIINSKFGKRQRSIGLHPLDPSGSYSITVKALDYRGIGLAQKVAQVTPDSTDTIDLSGEQIFLRANEIRHRSALLAWALHNVDPAKVKKIRLYVERSRLGSPQTVNLELFPDKRTFYLTRIPLDSTMCITVMALGNDGKPFLNSNMNFRLPAEEESYGRPLNGSPIS